MASKMLDWMPSPKQLKTKHPAATLLLSAMAQMENSRDKSKNALHIHSPILQKANRDSLGVSKRGVCSSTASKSDIFSPTHTKKC